MLWASRLSTTKRLSASDGSGSKTISSSCISGTRRGFVENTDDVAGLASGAIGDLVAAAGAVGGQDRVRGRSPHLGQDAELADFERHLVMLGLVPERPGHAATGRGECLDGKARDQLQGRDRGADRAERLLVTMSMQ